MGAWGTGLYQDDVAEDIKTDYIKFLKEGKTNQEAYNILTEENQMIINDVEDGPVFWFALADTQWKLGRLMPFVKEQALKYIEEGIDLHKWKEWGSPFLKRRIKVLDQLKDRLMSTMTAEKKVPTYKYYKCSWNIGDTYAYRLESEYAKLNNLYGHYIIIYKFDEYPQKKGNDYDVFPYVYTKVTKNSELPQTLDEVNNDCTFVRYLYNPPTRLFEYRTINILDSLKILKKMTYIGNFIIDFPKDELIKKDNGYPVRVMSSPKFEERIINSIIKLGKK
jgi:hypothetical protein